MFSFIWAGDEIQVDQRNFHGEQPICKCFLSSIHWRFPSEASCIKWPNFPCIPFSKRSSPKRKSRCVQLLYTAHWCTYASHEGGHFYLLPVITQKKQKSLSYLSCSFLVFNYLRSRQKKKKIFSSFGRRLFPFFSSIYNIYESNAYCVTFDAIYDDA